MQQVGTPARMKIARSSFSRTFKKYICCLIDFPIKFLRKYEKNDVQ